MTATPLPGGRLHLHAGPIDLVCQAWGAPGAVAAAYAAAQAAFPAILPGLCAELDTLRRPLPSPPPTGPVARAMHAACLPFVARFITPMAAVAGAVADTVLAAMCAAAELDRALVNNRGDVALHLAPGQSLRCGVVADVAAPILDGPTLDGPTLDGVLLLRADAPSRGVATSGRACKGRGGRSFSLGIADAVTVLARTAAEADAAATVIANATDLQGHPAVTRRPARDVDPDSDLGDRRVTWDLGPLRHDEIDDALANGAAAAQACLRAGLIHGAVLMLRGRVATCLPSIRLPEIRNAA